MSDLLSKEQFFAEEAQQLHQEYLSEDKIKYERLYNKWFFPKKEKELSMIASKVFILIGIEIQILVFFGTKGAETYFYSPYNLFEYGQKLRENSVFRDFTKLCFYIEENIKSED